MENAETECTGKYCPITGTIVDVHLIESKTPLRPRLVFNMLETGSTDGKKLYMEAAHTHSDATFVAAVSMVTAAYFREAEVNAEYLKAPEKIQDPAKLDDPEAMVSAHAVRVIHLPTRKKFGRQPAG